MNDPLAWLPALLQTNDALFPTGAYAHSLGFEEFAKLSSIRDEAGLRRYTDAHLLPALAAFELPYLRFAFHAANLAELCEIDREITASKLSRELRDASVQLGRRRLAALRAVNDGDSYREFASAVSDNLADGNHLTVCALQARTEGFPLDAALSAYFYQSVAGVCGAALKIIRIGQEGCQRVLRHALAQAGEHIRASLEVARDDAGYFDPLIEIASMRHEFANERLFIS
jgi:urease accessory protein